MTQRGCAGCRDGEELPFSFTMAFQPIVDVEAGRVWGYESLVRGPNGETARSILDRVNAANRYRFDQAARVKAIELAQQLFPRGEPLTLSINFLPNAVYEPLACIRASLAAARRVGFDFRRIMFEFTEDERLDAAHVKRIVEVYKQQGFLTGLDDFGSGYAGLTLLADFRPDVIKLDMHLVRGIAEDPSRSAIVAGIMHIARALNVTVLAEGVETADEVRVLRAAGIRLFQGFYFARPALESLPEVPVLSRSGSARAAG
jgi:EAL domain-containing protein (putative c-di-GMP-specific phosphodiesterase class I)